MSVQSDFQEKKEWFNVRKTVLEMLQDRVNSIPEEVSIVNFEQFSISFVCLQKKSEYFSISIFLKRKPKFQRKNEK